MARREEKGADEDSLLRDFESQIHGGEVFGSESPLDLRLFLQERELSLSGGDPRLERLLEAQLAFDIRTGRTTPDMILVNRLISQFDDLPPQVIRDLAILEYRLRLEAGHSVDSARFVSGVTGLNETHRSQLAEELKRLSYLEPTVRQPSEEKESPYQFKPGDRVGSFRIMKGIGRGGMGEVYVAQQLHPIRRTVALKVIQRRGLNSSEHRLRFEAERQAQAMMDHPHIAKVYEAGVTESGQAFVAMEYVSGTSIVKYCDDNRLTVNERLTLFLQTCRAIQHAHQEGIIHRDITPGNVLVADSDSGPTARVIDFGLAKALQPEVQLTEEEMYSVADSPLGTYLFMSPEQTGYAKRGTDVRTDVYSLGAVLYLLLTGTPPIADAAFREKSVVEKCTIICNEEPPRPSQRVSPDGAKTATIAELRKISPRSLFRVLHGELDWIVLKALEKDRERRYSTVADLAEDIERFLTQRPVKARPPSLTYRLSKAIRRNKAATIVMTTVVAATLGMSYQQLGQWKADATAATAIEAKRASDREALLQKLLVIPVGSTSDDIHLLALDDAIAGDLVTEIDQTDLQLAKVEVLHRLQSFDRLQQLIAEIRPITDRQRGQVELWNIRKAYQPDQQRKLAVELLAKQDDYQLDAPDVDYLHSLLASTRSEGIQTLYDVIDKSPQHEFSRKMLITLLLLEGRSQELERQIEQARLLFPGSVDVELAEGLALAFRGDRPGVESHLERLKSMDLLAVSDREFQEKFLLLLSRISETVLSFDVASNTNSLSDPIDDVIELRQLFANSSELSRLMREAFGPGMGIGIPETPAEPIDKLLSDAPARIPAANGALTLFGQPGLMNNLTVDVERLSPVPGDAFFARLRAYVCLVSPDFQGAAMEFDKALESPCIFPRLKPRLLYEAAMCHMGIYLGTGRTDQPELNKAGELALRWVKETDQLDPVTVQRIQNILNLSGQYDAALQLIDRYRKSIPPSSPAAFAGEELNIKFAARRFLEVIELADRLLASESGASGELVVHARQKRDEAISKLRELVMPQDKTDETP